MRASPTVLASAYSFVNEGAPPVTIPPSVLRGRWTCTITRPAGADCVHTLATGLLDVLHAGSYLVGSGWLDGTGGCPGAEREARSLGLEGPLFGAVRGEEVVLWVTNVFRTAMWVFKGTLDARGRVITGTALYNQTVSTSEDSLEAHFVLRRG